ncbi:hypothetical protein SprV_0100409100 [Sparganum proliferum]
MRHLAAVFDHFGVSSFEFLGHLVNSNGVHDFLPSTSKHHLQRFLGTVNFYRRSLPNCADTILTFTNLFSDPKGSFVLFDDASAAFAKESTALVSVMILAHSDPDAPVSIMVKAYVAFCIGLQQHLAGQTQSLYTILLYVICIW